MPPELYGMGLWEGVPLRDTHMDGGTEAKHQTYFLLRLPQRRSQTTLSGIPAHQQGSGGSPGELPVILCYKLNGQWLSQANGGPVRLIVPGLYGNRSIKWLQRIMITNRHQANDTYAEGNNDVESPIKTCARFINTPDKVRAGQKFALTGLAQVGILA